MIKNIFLTIFLSIFISISFSLMIYSKLFTENSISAQLNEINYYDFVYDDLINKLEEEIPNNELKYIYDSYITKDKIISDINKVLDSFYNKSENNVKNDFYNHIINKLGNKNDEHIKLLANNLANTYYNNLFRIDKLNIVISKMPLKNSSKPLAICSLFITIFMLLKVFFSKNNVSFYNSLIISGLLFIIPKVFIYLKDVLKNFYYYNNSLSYFIKMYGYSIINSYFKYGIIILIIGLLGFIIHFINKKN